MQDKIQSLIESIASDDNGKNAVSGLITALTENSEISNSETSQGTSNLQKSIDLLNTLMPIFPKKNINKVHLIIKILEVAILLDEIKHDTVN